MTERKTYSFPAYVHILIAFTAVFILFSIAYSFLVARHTSTVYFSQLEAAEKIKFEATTAHLWFEEIVSGDRHTSMDKIIEHIDSADWFAGAMIEGGENEHGKFFPLADPVMKQKIQEVRNELAEFKRITLKRWKMIETSGVGTSIDQEYDALFNRFILLAVEVEVNLKSLITSKSNTFHKILILVFIISIALFLITALTLRFHSLRRKQAEMALAESEEKYRTIVDNVHAGISKTNLKGELLFANKTLLDISGYESFEEMASSNILDSYVNSGDRDAFIEKLKKDGKVDNFHLDLKKKDGQPITVLINAILKDNEITNMLVDITNLKKAEEALKESEEKYKEFIEGTDDLITKVDSEGNFLFVNHMSIKIFGLSPEECIGRSAFLFVHQEDREKTNEWFNDLISRRADTGRIENRQVSVDGSISYLLWTTNLHYNKDGKVIYCNNITSNITERKKAENALIESEAKFKRLSNLAPVGVYLTDPDGKCIYANEKWLQMAGITFKDALGDGWMEGIHPDDRSEVFASWNKMVQSMGEWGLEYRFLNRQTNKESWVHGTATKILDSSDRVIGYIGANMDITERKMADDELRKISNQLQTNVSRMPIGYIMWDKEFKVEEWNYAAQEIFGYTKEEMLGRSPLDTIVPEEVRHLVVEVMNRLLSGTDEVNYSEGSNNIRKDGKIISCTWHNAPLKDSEGNISGVLSMVQDITDRKKAEEALRESEEKFRSFVVNSPAPMSIINVNSGEIEYLNRKNIEMLGYSHEDTPTIEEWQELVYPDKEYRNAVNKEFTAFLNDSDDIGDESATYERTLRCKDGSYKEAEIRFTKLKDKLIVVINDITEHKRAVNALSDITERLKRISDATFEGIVFSEKGKILDTNKQFARMFGYEQPELIGMDIQKLIAPEDRDLVRRNIAENNEDAYEMLSLRKDGSVINIEARGKALQHEGRTIRVTAIRDITEQKKFQAETMRSSQLASLGEMAAGVAHEINNPTSSIMLNAKLLMKARDMEQSELKEIHKRIYEDTERISEIVKSLLAFVRPGVSVRVMISVRELIDISLKLTQKHLQKNFVRLSIELEKNLPELVVFPQRIEQVFINIISNAIYALNEKYEGSDKDKKLHIGAECIFKDKGKVVRIAFTDHGPGVPGNMIEKIMSPFHSTKPAGEGTGLGLSISQGIISEHDGRIWVESEIGEYTTVFIELPVQEGV